MGTVAVIGGLGFLGFHLCGRLLEEGYKVIAVDPLHTERAEAQLELEMYLGRHTEFQFERVAIADYSLPDDVTAVIYVADSAGDEMQSLEETFRQCGEEQRVIVALPAVEKLNDEESQQPSLVKVEKYAETQGFDYILLQLPRVYGLHQSEETEEALLRAHEAEDRPSDWLYIEDAVRVFVRALTVSGHPVCEVICCEQGRDDDGENASCPLTFEPDYTFEEGYEAWREEKQEWERQRELGADC